MKTTVVQPHKSSLGMDANLAVVIIYIAMAVVGWIPYLGWFCWLVPIVFYFMEKNSGFVRFHAIMAAGTGAVLAVLKIIFDILKNVSAPRGWDVLTGSGWALYSFFGTIGWIINLIITLFIVYLLYTAWNYKQVELPLIGPMAAKAAVKLDEFGKKSGIINEDKKEETKEPPKDNNGGEGGQS